MYNPYDNKNYDTAAPAGQNGEQRSDPQKPAAPGYGTGASPYTAQTGNHTGAAYSESTHSGTPQSGSTYSGGGNGAAFSQPQTPASPYGSAQQPARAAYTWNSQGNQPYASQGNQFYYASAQPAKKKSSGKRAGKTALKVLAAVLLCAVVSFSSVGMFALLIQNGVIGVQSTGESEKTAAFTLYKNADSEKNATPTVTGEVLTNQQAAQKLIPSVVCVQNYQITQQGGFFFGYGGYEDTGEANLSPTGEGSGIIISKDGYIVTNQHVIDGATSLKVVTSEGLTYEAELIGEDTQTDLAVIKVTTEDELTPAEFGSSEDLQVADEVMAIGNPGGLQLNSSVTFGHISALNREVTNSDTGYSMKCIQTDAAINPGNSGGALVDQNGRVVGVNSSKIVATGYEGLGFAIPSDTVQPIVSDLIEFGYVKDRAMPGFSGQYIDRLTAGFYGMNAGYYVTQVTTETAAESGLRRGDMITAIDDTQITSASTITAYIANKKPGDTVTLTVDRSLTGQQGGKIELTLSENTGKSDIVSLRG